MGYNEKRILLIGKKEVDGKIIAEITNMKNESVLIAVGTSINSLISNLRYKLEDEIILEKPLVTNGYRVSQSTGEYIPCERVSKELEEKILGIVYPSNEIKKNMSYMKM